MQLIPGCLHVRFYKNLQRKTNTYNCEGFQSLPKYFTCIQEVHKLWKKMNFTFILRSQFKMDFIGKKFPWAKLWFYVLFEEEKTIGLILSGRVWMLYQGAKRTTSEITWFRLICLLIWIYATMSKCSTEFQIDSKAIGSALWKQCNYIYHLKCVSAILKTLCNIRYVTFNAHLQAIVLFATALMQILCRRFV